MRNPVRLRFCLSHAASRSISQDRPEDDPDALEMTDDEKQEGQPGFVGWPGEQTGGVISSLVRGGRPTDRHGFGIGRRLLHGG